jgi:hypothetical protein
MAAKPGRLHHRHMIRRPENEFADQQRPFADLSDETLEQELMRELMRTRDEWRLRLLLLERDRRLRPGQ